jgi:predicted dehydrogenase
VTSAKPVRWGVLGTANIARGQFVPALRQAGGAAAAVAGRDPARTSEYARANEIGRAITGYQDLLDDPEIDAVYIALPNALHADWTIRALEAGKAVLCEKPLCGTLADTERVLTAARTTGTFLWEAFVFPFHPQVEQIRELIAAGAIGELMEIKSNFHFALRTDTNIRLSADLEGGALLDVGCYPVRLAQEIFGPQYTAAWARAVTGGDGVDVDTWGVLSYPGGRRLMLSCGFGRSYDTAATLEGTGGRITVTNPFHPGPADYYTVEAGQTKTQTTAAPGGERSFTAAIRHINAVLRAEEAPRLLAIETSLATALALHDLADSFASSSSTAGRG